jgi:hypothetical protein
MLSIVSDQRDHDVAGALNPFANTKKLSRLSRIYRLGEQCEQSVIRSSISESRYDNGRVSGEISVPRSKGRFREHAARVSRGR